ncbi:MAG: hypothetical protein NTY12_02760 [Candidatus Falkowbacteria bacterium]|nr:hypothetical protein [Candidatus Falkowbacteria bacterium]
MITKQKIKQLEESLSNLRGDKIFCCMKKYNEEVYSYNGKIYYNLQNVEKDINFCTGDFLVVLTDFGNSSFNNKTQLN